MEVLSPGIQISLPSFNTAAPKAALYKLGIPI